MTTFDDLFNELSAQLGGASGNAAGKITVKLANVECNITGKDAVGHLVQEWLFKWCEKNKFEITKNSHTHVDTDRILTQCAD